MASSARQLVVFCDGTNNNLTGGRNDTNTVKLCELLAGSADAAQLVYFDPGVGNPAELPGATLVDGWRRWSERLAGLVNQFGILQPHMESMVITLVHGYFSDRRLDPAAARGITAQTARLFVAPDARNVELQFVGVWDTVASVGMWPFSARFTALPTVGGKRFRHVRQALALDQHRAQFKPRAYADANGDYLSATSPKTLPPGPSSHWSTTNCSRSPPSQAW